ncbi:hypothetical protein DFAR_630037 [Desulfarculales bacterium]
MGSGKSTALRWAASRPHPSEYQIIWATASQGSILEFYRQICVELAGDTTSFSRAVLTKIIRKQILEVAQDRKKQSVLVLDKAALLRLQVLAELHTTALSFRETPNQSCPSSWPVRTQPRRLPHIQNLLALGLQGRGQKSSGRCLPPEYPGLPPAPPQNRRLKIEFLL